MKRANYRSGFFLILISGCFIFSGCSEWVIPVDVPGTYLGKQRAIIRYDRGGQLIFREDHVLVSLIIDNNGRITGMVGEAAFETCNLTQNRGWISRQLNIKTDYLIKGKLKGFLFEHDTIISKDISIPFNIKNGELKGSLFVTSKGQSYPVISILKLQKR